MRKIGGYIMISQKFKITKKNQIMRVNRDPHKNEETLKIGEKFKGLFKTPVKLNVRK